MLSSCLAWDCDDVMMLCGDMAEGGEVVTLAAGLRASSAMATCSLNSTVLPFLRGDLRMTVGGDCAWVRTRVTRYALIYIK